MDNFVCLTLPKRQYSRYSEVQVLFKTPEELTFHNSSDINSSEQKSNLAGDPNKRLGQACFLVYQ